jgi:hypothetical protein
MFDSVENCDTVVNPSSLAKPDDPSVLYTFDIPDELIIDCEAHQSNGLTVFLFLPYP